jgi:nitrate/nitrite transporter NarK
VSTRAVAAGSAVGFSAGWNIADVGSVADELADAYGVDLAVIGLFTTVLFLAHMLMQLPSGRLSDRFGAMRVCAAGLAVLALCNAVAAIAAAPTLALTARLAMGVGTALAFIGGSDYVRATGGSPFAQGLYGGLATAGGGAALAIVPLLVDPLGWRAPYLSAIAVAVAAGLLLAAGPRVPVVRRAAGERAALSALARDGRLLRLAVVFAASFGLSVVVANWVVTLLEETAGLSSAQAGALGAATLTLGIVSRPLGGWLLRVHPQHVRAAIVVSAGVGCAGTLALASGSAPLALAGACAVGLAAGIPFATSFTGAASLYRTSPATAVGLVNATGAFTVLALTPLVGVAFSRDAGVTAFVALAALWALGGLALPRDDLTVT